MVAVKDLLKELSKIIGKRISNISFSREIYKYSNIECKDALKNSECEEWFVYENNSVDKNDEN